MLWLFTLLVSPPLGTLCVGLSLGPTAFRVQDDHPLYKLQPLAGWRCTLPWLPTLCNLTGTTLMNISLLYAPVSTYQMTHGSLVRFVGVLSVLFLRHHLWLYQWFSLSTIIMGVALVGFSGSLVEDVVNNLITFLDLNTPETSVSTKVILAYKREATEHDTNFIEKYDEDLNTALVFTGLFSAVSSTFVIDAHSDPQPDPKNQPTTPLRAIHTLNRSAIPNEAASVPPALQNPPSKIITMAGFMYVSPVILLLAPFVAILGKQWLNWYLRHTGGSMTQRHRGRQRKCDRPEKWSFPNPRCNPKNSPPTLDP